MKKKEIANKLSVENFYTKQEYRKKNNLLLCPHDRETTNGWLGTTLYFCFENTTIEIEVYLYKNKLKKIDKLFLYMGEKGIALNYFEKLRLKKKAKKVIKQKLDKHNNRELLKV